MAEWILDISEPFHEEPFRARSHTWPLPPTSLSIKSDDGLSDPNNNNNISLSGGEVSSGEIKPNGSDNSSSGHKKNSSRRNAWGNMSYADLITQAIQSSSEKRLTLSQIYDWMVQNVPYFKDKGDSNSSAGWKNSIRHNLSLHNRFKRVQNEGTGKSSWWVINPEAKPGKAARRRAASMETQKYEKKRGRVKKKVEALRNGTILDDKPSPGSSVSEGLDMFPESPLHHGFQLSPDFRPRASSNASSCGRLSPIIIESDLHDDHAPSLSPLSSWYNTNDVQDAYTDKLVEMANTMKLGAGPSYSSNSPNSPSQQSQTQQSSQQPQQHHHLQSQQQNGSSSSPSSNLLTKSYTNLNSFGATGSTVTYSTTSCNSIGQSSCGDGSDIINSSPNGPTSSLNCNSSESYFTSSTHTIDSNITLTTLNTINNNNNTSTRSPNKPIINSEAANFGANQNSANSSFSSSNMSPSLSPSQSMDLLSSSNQVNSPLNNNNNYGSKGSQQSAQNQHQSSSSNRQLTSQNRGFGSTGLDNNTLRRLNNNSKLLGSLSSLGTTASQVMGHILSFNNPLPNDLDLNMDSLQGGLECDVDQVIRHELSVEGNLDFNFESMQASDDNSIQGLNGTFRSSQMSNI